MERRNKKPRKDIIAEWRNLLREEEKWHTALRESSRSAFTAGVAFGIAISSCAAYLVFVLWTL